LTELLIDRGSMAAMVRRASVQRPINRGGRYLGGTRGSALIDTSRPIR